MRGDVVGCDFITEFIAPGGGYGRRGAGMRLLADLKRQWDGTAGREVHGHVWRGNGRARTWWARRGMHMEWEEGAGQGGGDGVGTAGRVYQTDDGGEYGYMRGRWADIQTRGGAEVSVGTEDEERMGRICRVYDTVRWRR